MWMWFSRILQWHVDQERQLYTDLTVGSHLTVALIL